MPHANGSSWASNRRHGVHHAKSETSSCSSISAPPNRLSLLTADENCEKGVNSEQVEMTFASSSTNAVQHGRKSAATGATLSHTAFGSATAHGPGKCVTLSSGRCTSSVSVV